MGEPAKKRGGYSPFVLLPIGFIALFIGAFVYTCRVTGKATDTARTYIHHVREGRLHEAYAMLASSRKQQVSEAAFERAMSTPELRTSTSFAWSKTDGIESGDKYCVIGGIHRPQGDLNLRVFLLAEGDELRVYDVITYDTFVKRGPWLCDGN